MRILAFDSTAKSASVAVSEDAQLLGLYNIDNGLTHSELLLPMAENLLKSLKLTFSDIDIFATAVGPGSFTGVRIGVSLVKGLAFGKNKSCVAISTIEQLAESLSSLKGILVPVMDARRSQVYTAIFESDGENLTRLTPDSAISINELAAKLKKYSDKDIYINGDGYNLARNSLKQLGIETKNTPPLLINSSAFSCALVALKKIQAGDFTDDKEILPTYLRLPQAQRELLEREKHQ